MDSNANFLKGLDKLKDNQFEQAIELFTRAIESDGTNPFYFNNRAVAYLNLEKFELSMFDMNKSIELDDNYAYFYSCRGFLKAKLRDAEGAIADYEKSLQLDPKNEITYNNLGLVLEQVGNMNRAKRMYKKGNDVLGYDPERRVLNEEGTHMEDSGISMDESYQPLKPEKETFPKDDVDHKQERKQLAKDVFSKRSTFREFLRFIRNGFKLKEDEKS